MGRHVWWLFGSLLLASSTASTASARTWFATPDGSAGDGTVADILPHVEHGDSLILGAGVHGWSDFEVSTSMHVLGQPGSSVEGKTTVVFRDSEYVTLENVKFQGLDGAGLFFGGVASVVISSCEYVNCDFAPYVHAEQVLIEHSRFVDNETPNGCLIGSGVVLVRDCIFAGNRSFGQNSRFGGALAIARDATATIRRCIFDGNAAIEGAAVWSIATKLLLEDNTIVRNEGERSAVYAQANGAGSIVRQNIFANNSGFGLVISDIGLNTTSVYCNGFWSNNANGAFDPTPWEGGEWAGVNARGYSSRTDFYSVLQDPLICEPGYSVSESSPLADPEGPCEAIGGAAGFGCDIKPVHRLSWGRLKSAVGQ